MPWGTQQDSGSLYASVVGIIRYHRSYLGNTIDHPTTIEDSNEQGELAEDARALRPVCEEDHVTLG